MFSMSPRHDRQVLGGGDRRYPQVFDDYLRAP
jgi:hypothetical protein